MTLKTNKIFPRDGQVSGAYGGIIQVVSASTTAAWSQTTSGTTVYDVTGLSVSITPQSASNKVYIMAMVNFACDSTGGIIYLRRNTSDEIFIGDASSNRGRGTAHPYAGNDAYTISVPIMYLDSPAATTATTYKISVQETDGGGNVIYINQPSSTTDSANRVRTGSSITAMEVSA